MFKPVPQHLNSQNLIEISAALSGIEHFIFFGTLLGIARDGDIIPNDDDIDIYVDMNFRLEAISALSKNGFNILEGDHPNNSNYFLQLIIERENILTYVDFYFFDSSDKNYIIDKWNFIGKINSSAHEMHVPKDLIFPIKSYDYMNNKISIPANMKELCLFLYGKKWSEPLKKGRQYSTVILNHKPKIYTGFFGRVFVSIIEWYRKKQN